MYLFLILLDVIWCLIKTEHVVLPVNNKKIKTISAIAMFFPYWISFTYTVQHTLWERFLSFFLTNKNCIHVSCKKYPLTPFLTWIRVFLWIWIFTDISNFKISRVIINIYKNLCIITQYNTQVYYFLIK